MASYYERLDNLFAAYAPEKRPLVAGILQKYCGREEEVLQSLVKKFGPEPRGASNNAAGGCGYRERLVRFYTKYAPEKLVTVETTLARCAGCEEELFSALVEKYGPEPSGSRGDGGSKCGERISDTQSDLSHANSSIHLAPYNVHDPRWRLARIFMQYAPEKVAIVDQMMEKYAGREEEMLASCVQRYGPEPPPPDIQSPRSRLLRLIEHYVPRKASSVDTMLQRYDGRTEALFAALVHKLGPEPPAPPLGNGLHKLTYRQRLVRFYKFYARERLTNVDTILRRYKGDEELMFHILVEKYGPEPDYDLDVDAPITPDKDYRARLTRIFTKYAPERVNSVPHLLEKYRGCEANIIKALVEKLGPEPPVGASSTEAAVEHVGSEGGGPGTGDPPSTCEYQEDDKKEGGEAHRDLESPDAWLSHLSLPLSVYRRYAVNRLGEGRVSKLENLFGIPRLPVNGNGGDEKGEKCWVPVKTGTASNENVNAAQETEESQEPMIAECMSANFACLLLILETVEFPLPVGYVEGEVFSRYPFCTVLSDRDRFTLRTCAALVDLQARFESDTASLLQEEETCRGLLWQPDSWKEQDRIRLEAREAYLERLVQKALELLPEFEERERQEITTVEHIERKGKASWFYEGLRTLVSGTEDARGPREGQMQERDKNMGVGGQHVDLSPPFAVCRGFHDLFSPHLPRGPKRENYVLRSPQSPGDGQGVGDPTAITTPVSCGPGHTTQWETSPCNFSALPDASPPPRKPRDVGVPNERVLRFGGEKFTGNRQAAHAGNRVDMTGRDKWGPAKDGRLSQVAPVPCRDAREAILLGEDPGRFCGTGTTWPM